MDTYQTPGGKPSLIPSRAARVRRLLPQVAAVVIALGVLAAPVQATNWVVQVGGSRLAYNPQFLTIQPGDTVRFASLGGYHNVVADDGSFRCARGCDGDGMGGSGGATSQIWSATVAFGQAGRFGYFCEPHGAPGQGMYGAITVQGPAPPQVEVGVGGWFYGVLLGALLLATATLRLRGRALARGADQARKPM